MMQFSEIPTFLHQQPNSISSYQTTMINKPPQTCTTTPTTITTKPWNVFPTQPKFCVSNYLSGNTNCIEQLLLHCAEAILNNNDPTPAQQILWVLNNIAPPDNDNSNHRLTRAFIRALILRTTLNPKCKFICDNNSNSNNNNDCYSMSNNSQLVNYKMSLLEVANFVHLTPWYRFGYTAANLMILDAVEKYSNGLSNSIIIHIVDVSITQCMQMPTLIDLISTRFQPPLSPPFIRLTVGVVTEHVPPMFDCVSYEDVGLRLINFARSRRVVLEFNVVHTTPSDGFASLVDEVRHQQHHRDNLHYTNDNVTQEMLVINCHMTLHFLQQHDEFGNDMISPRTVFLNEMRNLEPDIAIIVEEDVDFTSNNLVERLKSAFNYFWIPFDTVDTFLSKENKERECYEADICWKIENVITYEGAQRVERQEPRWRWVERMGEARFQTVGFGEEAVAEVKGMVEEHGVGWGSKKEEDHLVLSWKGHNVAFASAWIPT